MSDVFSSVFSTVNGLVYRCANDASHTMQFMEGSAEALTGYTPDRILDNADVTFTGLMDKKDVKRVTAEVDDAITHRKTWDVFYHLVHREGHLVPVRERGNAVYKNGELTFLEGLVVSAEAESTLIRDMDSLTAKTRDANADIVDLTKQITQSLRALKMLSINAGIEAARSGDAGRGFAVVANEIKALAEHNSTFIDVIQKTLAKSGAGPQP